MHNKTRVESAFVVCNSKLKYDQLFFPSFAFEFNLRRYSEGECVTDVEAAALEQHYRRHGKLDHRQWVGWCRLTLSNPR